MRAISSFVLSVACAAVFCSAASAVMPQSETPQPGATSESAAAALKPLHASVTPKAVVMTQGEALELNMTVQVLTDSDVPATLLSGYDFDVFVGNNKVGELTQAVSGSIGLNAGTEVTRTIALPLGNVLGEAAAAELQLVTVRWRGEPRCETQVRVAPDQSAIDVDALDLSSTEVLLVTNYGEMRVSFFPNEAPQHVKSFVKLSKDGYYNGTKFHRLIEGFMIQGGCPNTKAGATGMPGTGSPGYTIPAEFSKIEHVRGILSAARGNDINSAGSQFFVMHGAAAHLNGKYSAFGKLESGLETLDKIATLPKKKRGRVSSSDPVSPVHLYAAIVQAR